MLTLTSGIAILFEKIRSEKGGEFEKHLLHCSSRFGVRWGFHARPVFFFNIFSHDPRVNALTMRFYNILPNYWSEYWTVEEGTISKVTVMCQWRPGSK